MAATIAMNTIALAPQTTKDLGIRKSLLEDLALKILYINGEILLCDLAEQMRLGLGVVEGIFQHLRKEQHCEVKGMVGAFYRISATSQGKARALELLSQNQYAGAAPVSLSDYVNCVRAQSVRNASVGPSDVQRAFEHLVLSSPLLMQVGTAIVSGTSIFLHGPSGTGKTAIAETLSRIHPDGVWIPYAVELDSEIIVVYDAAVHQRIEECRPKDTDPRWVLCRRPRVVVGGELTIEMLDLQFNPVTKFYAAPLQMKANNGVLVIDDFGRQRVRPEELLNRWIVPLDRRIDFLTLAGGKKFEIPFDLLVVFATNLDPSKLTDEAFLRRIQNKIKVDHVNARQFHAIFQGVCRQFSLEYNASVVDELIDLLTKTLHEPLRPCYARDLVQQICWTARYEGKEPHLDRSSIVQACRNYFISG